MLLKLADLYRKESEELDLTFYDDNGNRYLNCPLGSCTEGHVIQLSHHLLISIKGHYVWENDEFICFLNELPRREKTIIYWIYTRLGSREILLRNGYGFDQYNPNEHQFYSEEDRRFCEALLALIKEIKIRTYNYSRYVTKDYTPDDVKRLYERIAEGLEKHRAEVNVKDSQKTIEKPGSEKI